jgi:hypothetical protein
MEDRLAAVGRAVHTRRQRPVTEHLTIWLFAERLLHIDWQDERALT